MGIHAQMEEKMEVFVCLFEIEINGVPQHRRMKAPRLFIEQEYASLVYEAAQNPRPVRVKISRTDPVWNQFDQEWVEREYSIDFANNAYVALHKENY